ncbi:hypothetical protein BH93_11450 [Rhodococcoides fascians A25f]|uniref:hypothetical protein n=1 Tax=Rhodococcoides fascians TaxID=1828 RepID=UPI00055ACC42|nr:hypothetical protein [Rhodococcus fascians]QII05906.1 hypothetical protein BH93_11450 [Rhodococcus fascians A25f]
MTKKRRPTMAMYWADRRRASIAWEVFLTSEQRPDRSYDVLTELIDSAKEEDRLDRLMLALMHVARDIVPQLGTAMLSEVFNAHAMRAARLEAEARIPAVTDDPPGDSTDLAAWMKQFRRDLGADE